MKTELIFAMVLSTLVGAPLLAQHDHSTHHSQYADQERSGIASLTRSERNQLETGEGMGLARPAELNRYPGPKHVLDAARELDLTEEQLARTKAIFMEMKKEAVRLGKEIVRKEALLSRRFEHAHIDQETLSRITDEIGELQGRLRFVHLKAHLEMKRVLTAEQIERYDELRGYEQ